MKTAIILFNLILSICTFLPSIVYANIPADISSHFKSTPILQGQIDIKAPDIAENGAVVFVGIRKISGIPSGAYVTELYLFSAYRKNPVAIFRLGRNSIATGLHTRIKLKKSAFIYAIAKLSNGMLLSGRKLVKITMGGCGSDTGGNYIASTTRYIPRPNPQRQHEKYRHLAENAVHSTINNPVSTFSIDVDTSSYANVRRFLLKQGRLPVANAVRSEEMINYFNYQYPVPAKRDVPFSITTETGPNPWNKNTHLIHIGLQGYTIPKANLPPANLVFLIDVSGSMASTAKLGLLKTSLILLTRQLTSRDSVSIVVYAGASGVVLKPTPGNQKQRIINALKRLRAGGSTNGGAGLKLAYAMARQAYIKNGTNRVIIASDGDFNVGTTNHQQLIKLVEKESKNGISLTTLGFGMGNYNDYLMEQMADKGNGNSAYIDSLKEAKKVLIDQMSGTLHTIAKDVKIQVQFNPAVVTEYRLVGYENRHLKREDFNNDKVDAGDIGAGHSVTAIYEISLKGSKGSRLGNFRYQKPDNYQSTDHFQNEIALVRLRYKTPGKKESRLVEKIITRQQIIPQLDRTSNNYRFSAAVAAFAQRLRNSKYTQTISFQQILKLARSSMGDDPDGYRREFIDLVSLSDNLVAANR